ncbi:MAG: hypothetical protein HY860_03935 [Chlamydiales bacterium]|nr:hypothetical protein [Chlamydiales bacterium]
MDSDKIYILPSFDHGGGVFHNFMNVIGFLDYCEQHKIINYMVDFSDKGHYYDKEIGPNWWQYYFEPIEHKSNLVKLLWPLKRTKKRMSSDKMAVFVKTVEFQMPRYRANEIIKKYIKVKPALLTEIDMFTQQHFQSHFVIGIHYRATDKTTTMQGYAEHEASFVPYAQIFATIDNYIQEHHLTDYRLFVATDSEDFLNAIKKQYGPIVAYTNSIRSIDGSPLHYNVKNVSNHYYYLQGKETVIDCILLSKCDFLIKTSSNLNLCSCFFNPNLPFISLNDRLEASKH